MSSFFLMRQALRVFFALGLTSFVNVESAGASPSFPSAIQSALDLPCRPECIICHRDLEGGYGTLNKPFGNAMFEVGGLVATDPDTVAPALAALEAAASDVDADGVGDVDELRVLDDPNAADAMVECLPDEKKSSDGGCAIRPVKGRSSSRGWLVVFAAGSAWTLRRRLRQIVAGSRG